MNFCITCKEIVDDQFTVVVKNRRTRTEFQDTVCGACYDKLQASHHGEGMFAIHSAFRWLRWRQQETRKSFRRGREF
ncbi:MAG: hypothetical protein KKA90_02730 [Nanoarchaeota archaeon]|nr:hypothetical protein [Nanoarchaeota archaeon]